MRVPARMVSERFGQLRQRHVLRAASGPDAFGLGFGQILNDSRQMPARAILESDVASAEPDASSAARAKAVRHGLAKEVRRVWRHRIAYAQLRDESALETTDDSFPQRRNQRGPTGTNNVP